MRKHAERDSNFKLRRAFCRFFIRRYCAQDIRRTSNFTFFADTSRLAPSFQCVSLCSCVFRLKVLRTISPCGRNLAAREETTAVREEHFENRSSLRLPLQKLFDVFVFQW